MKHSFLTLTGTAFLVIATMLVMGCKDNGKDNKTTDSEGDSPETIEANTDTAATDSLLSNEVEGVKLDNGESTVQQNKSSDEKDKNTSKNTSSGKQNDGEYHAKVTPLDYSNMTEEGTIAIEDFGGVMGHFKGALAQAGGRPVRIAFFGDSFIEGDLVTSDLREMLQSRYGGKGVGWVDISCVSEKYRTSAVTSNSGWEKHHVTDGKSYKSGMGGLNGGYFIPKGNATFTVTTSRGHAASADKATVFLSPSNVSLKGSVNGGEMTDLTIKSNGTLGIAEVTGGNISRFTLNASGTGQVMGVALDGNTGIVLDNYSMRGTNGVYTSNVPSTMLSAFAQYRPYDLIIFEYGLNIANKKTTNYTNYTNQFRKVIRTMKSNFPNATILVISCCDRGEKIGNEVKTMTGIKELVEAQRQMAADEGVAFWNLYLAMGGEGAMGRMQQKGQAGKDYTHINAAGGKVVAKYLFDALTK